MPINYITDMIKVLFSTIMVMGTYPQISPNGEFIIYVKNNDNDVRNLFKYDMNGDKEASLVDTNINVIGYELVGDRYIFYTTTDSDHKFSMFTYDLKTDKIHDITKLIGEGMGHKVTKHPDNYTSILIEARIENKIKKVNLAKRTIETVGVIQPDYYVDKNLDIILHTAEKDGHRLTKYKGKTILNFSPDEHYSVVLSMTADSKYVYYRKYDDSSGKSLLMKYNLITGKEQLVTSYVGSLESTITDNNNYVEGIGVYRYKMDWIFFDKKVQSHMNYIINHHTVDYVTVLNTTNKYWVYSVKPSNRSPFTILYDLKSRRITELYKTFLKLDQYKFKKEKLMLVKATDGLNIPCYYTEPTKTNRPYPTILLVHGGPQSNYANDFSPQAQFFAQLGFATVRVNFRGSTIGIDFRTKALGEFGGKIIDDINDVAKHLIKTGFADQNKLGIYGHSYGAYAALMVTIKEPNLYKFAIPYGGTADVRKSIMVYKKRFGKSYSLKYAYFPEDVLTNDKVYKSISPIHHYKKIKANILFIEGKHNLLSVGTIKELYEKMQKNGQQVKLLYYEDEGHVFLKQDNIVDMWRNIAEFVKEYIINYRDKYNKYKAKYLELKGDRF